MSSRPFRPTVWSLALLFAAGCSDGESSPGDDTDDTSQEEANVSPGDSGSARPDGAISDMDGAAPRDAGGAGDAAAANDAGPDASGPAPREPVRFAVIGDFGNASAEEGEVAALVKRLAPELVITTGDNNYPLGEASTIDAHIGAYYGEYIAEAATNRFFPSAGNHDWGLGNLDAYLDYFDLPGNERYYEFERGPVHFFAIDSDPHEPDGITVDSLQAAWLRDRLAASTLPFKVVYFHHPPYTSGYHGNNASMAWPFAEWGASLVLTGHEHDYERLSLSPGVPLVVNGIGGVPLRLFNGPEQRSQLASDKLHGAMLIEADDERLEAFTYSAAGGVIDHFVLKAGIGAGELGGMPVAVARGSSFRASTATPPAGWAEPAFDDASWATVSTPAGFGQGDEATELRPASAAVWLRREFSLEHAAQDVWLRLVCDDGAVVYLNGHEVHRVNLPGGELNANSWALTAVANDWENRAVDTMLDERHLVPGKNVIAVAVHQQAPASSDLRFDLELRVR